MDESVVSCLLDAGIKNTDQFTEAAASGVSGLEQRLHLSDGQLSAADPQTLHTATARANDSSRFYRGSVGLRDIRRVIQAARYVSWTNRN